MVFVAMGSDCKMRVVDAPPFAWMEFPKPPRDGVKILHLDDLSIHKAYGRV